MGKDTLDTKSLLPLEKYLETLVKTYPTPIRANELADKTGYSKAAVSKIRDRLLQICDQNIMLFDKGFVLSDSLNILPQIFIVFLAHGKHRSFLASRFFKAFIKPEKIHQRIAEIFPLYANVFTVEETGFLIGKLVESINRLPEADFKFLLKLISAKKPADVLKLKSLDTIQESLKKLEFTLNNKEELLIAIQLRDKFFFIIRDFLWAQIDGMRILKREEFSKRESYIFVYKDTIDFYLRDVFENVKPGLSKAGKKFLTDDIESQIQIGASQYAPRNDYE